MENFNIVNAVFAAGGFAVSTIIWWTMWNISKSSLRRKIRREMYADLPTNIVDIERSRNLERAYHQVELKQLELRIAEMKRDVAESEAKVSESLGRISELNNKIEVMMLERRATEMADQLHLDLEEQNKSS